MEIIVVTLVEEQMSPWKVEGTSLDPPWSELELHLSGDEFLRVRMDMGDKEVTKQDLVAKVVMEVLGRLLGDMVVMSWRCLRC
ncbi:hypothetical protein Tco_0663137 [Tanacetum coccineum]